MGGERAGKSWEAGLWGTCRTFDPGASLIWLVAIDYELTRPEFEYMLDMSQQLDNYESHNMPRSLDEPSTLITRTGVKVQTKTARDPRKLAGVAPDAGIGCEVALWDAETYRRFMGRMAEHRAPTWMSGSFETSIGHIPDLWKRWQGENIENGRSYSITSGSNIVIYPGGEDDPELLALKATMPEHKFIERHMGRPSPPSGLVYKGFDPAVHVKKLDIDWNKEVYLAIDPGWEHAYALLAVQVTEKDQIRVIDEIYVQNYYHEEVIREVQKRPWWKLVRHGAIDKGGSQHHNNESGVEAWKRVANLTLSNEKIDVQAGIMRVYSFLRPGNLYVDPKCVGLLSEFGAGPPPWEGAGPWKYRTNRDGNVLSDKPENVNDNASKALAYLLVDLFGYVKRPNQSGQSYIGSSPVNPRNLPYDQFTPTKSAAMPANSYLRG